MRLDLWNQKKKNEKIKTKTAQVDVVDEDRSSGSFQRYTQETAAAPTIPVETETKKRNQFQERIRRSIVLIESRQYQEIDRAGVIGPVAMPERNDPTKSLPCNEHGKEADYNNNNNNNDDEKGAKQKKTR